jgi:hypothetical protein
MCVLKLSFNNKKSLPNKTGLHVARFDIYKSRKLDSIRGTGNGNSRNVMPKSLKSEILKAISLKPEILKEIISKTRNSFLGTGHKVKRGGGGGGGGKNICLVSALLVAHLLIAARKFVAHP